MAVYRDSFPTGMPIPKAPKSPSPKILSPLVTTIAWQIHNEWKERKMSMKSYKPMIREDREDGY